MLELPRFDRDCRAPEGILRPATVAERGALSSPPVRHATRMPAMRRAGCHGSRDGRRPCCVMPGWQYAGEGRQPVCMVAIAIGSPISDF